MCVTHRCVTLALSDSHAAQIAAAICASAKKLALSDYNTAWHAAAEVKGGKKYFTPLPHPLQHLESETASFSALLLHGVPHFYPRVQVFAVTQIGATICAACESESASPNLSVRLKKALMAPP